MSAAEAAAIVDTADKGVKAANGALDLYNKMINQVIPWDEFKEAMEALKANQKQYSDEAAKQVGSIQTLLLNSNDNYDSSVQSVYRWCKMASPVLGQYMSLFAHTTDPKVAEAQKILLLKVLNDGSSAMETAIDELEESKKSFNGASGELTTLKTTLDNDFSKGSSYFDSKVTALRTKAYAGAAAGVFFGPIGLAISYGIAAGVTEGELIPKLEKAFAETQKMFDNLQDIVTKAQESITEAKASLGQEIRVLGVMSAKVEETKTFAETWALVPSLLFDPLKKSTTELIGMCDEYIVNADKKYAAADETTPQ